MKLKSIISKILATCLTVTCTLTGLIHGMPKQKKRVRFNAWAHCQVVNIENDNKEHWEERVKGLPVRKVELVLEDIDPLDNFTPIVSPQPKSMSPGKSPILSPRDGHSSPSTSPLNSPRSSPRASPSTNPLRSPKAINLSPLAQEIDIQHENIVLDPEDAHDLIRAFKTTMLIAKKQPVVLKHFLVLYAGHLRHNQDFFRIMTSPTNISFLNHFIYLGNCGALNECDDEGWTLLHHAAHQNNAVAVEWLLDNNALVLRTETYCCCCTWLFCCCTQYPQELTEDDEIKAMLAKTLKEQSCCC